MAFDVGSVIAHIKADISDFQNGMSEAEKRIDGFKTRMDNLGSGLSSFGKKMSLFVTTPIIGLGTLAIKTAGEFEQLKIAITTMLGSEERAVKLLKDIEAFSKRTPFQFSELATTTKQLLAYGFSAENVMGVLKSLGDVAAGVGRDKLPQLVLAIGQINAKGQLMGQELRQLQETGFPILDMLAEHFSKSKDEIYKMVSAGEISSEVVLQMFQQATSSGGQFFDLMEKTSQTTLGQFSNLQDSIGFLARDIGTLLLPAAMFLIEKVKILVDWVNSLSESNKKTIVIIAIVVAAIGPLLIILGVLVSGISAVITIAGVLGTMLAFLAANPIVLLIAAIGALYMAWKTNFLGIQDHVRDLSDFVRTKFDAMVNFLREVGGRVKDAIVRPFAEAWDRIQDLVNKIKDKLDFTKRNSPSVVDIVRTGVTKVNDALSDLAFGTTFNANAAGAAVNYGGGQNSTTIVQVSMAGAVISDAFGAGQMGELLGDAIIKRLQQQIRI